MINLFLNFKFQDIAVSSKLHFFGIKKRLWRHLSSFFKRGAEKENVGSQTFLLRQNRHNFPAFSLLRRRFPLPAQFFAKPSSLASKLAASVSFCLKYLHRPQLIICIIIIARVSCGTIECRWL